MELRDYLTVISARRQIIICAIMVVTVAAAIASVLKRPIYEAQSVLLVKERNGASSVFGAMLPGVSLQPERLVQTHVKLLQMSGVMEQAARRLSSGTQLDYAGVPLEQASVAGAAERVTPTGGGRVTGEEIRSKMTVDVDPQTNLIYVKIRDNSAQQAAAMADAVAVQYARSNRALNTAEIENARREVSYKLRDIQEDVFALSRVVGGGRKSPRTGTRTAARRKTRRVSPVVVKNAAARLKMAMGMYQMLASKEEELKISESMEPGEVVVMQGADVASRPVESTPLKNVFLGLVLGVVLDKVPLGPRYGYYHYYSYKPYDTVYEDTA